MPKGWLPVCNRLRLFVAVEQGVITYFDGDMHELILFFERKQP